MTSASTNASANSAKAKVAEAIDINKIMRTAFREAEKKTGLAPVFLKRESFAGSATTTGSLCLDTILGGGIPPGRIVGIAGPERAGKTLLSLKIQANHLAANGFGVIMDAEGGSDPLFLKAQGINFEKYRGKRNKNNELKPGEVDLINFYQPETIEEFAEYIQVATAHLPENRNPDKPVVIYVLDSVIALITDALRGDIDANKMAYHARAYADFIPIVNSALIKSGSTLVYTNQLRQKPGVAYGSPVYEPAGDTLKYFSSIRMMLSNSKPKLNNGDHPFIDKATIPGVAPKQGGVWEEPHYDKDGTKLGTDRYIYTAIRTIKNRLFNPQQVCWVRIQFEENGSTGHGLDPVFDIFTFLFQNGFIRNVAKTAKTVTKGVFEAVTVMDLDPVKVFGLPSPFNYQEFKFWVGQTPEAFKVIRDRALVSGLVYNKD